MTIGGGSFSITGPVDRYSDEKYKIDEAKWGEKSRRVMGECFGPLTNYNEDYLDHHIQEEPPKRPPTPEHDNTRPTHNEFNNERPFYIDPRVAEYLVSQGYMRNDITPLINQSANKPKSEDNTQQKIEICTIV